MTMITPIVTLRPDDRASIKLPWRGSSEANYSWLKEVCGPRSRPKYDPALKCFLVARSHTQRVIDALVKEYDQVSLIQFGHTATTCVEQCWNANPDKVIDCECSCAGTNHGSGVPLGKEIQDGLSVRHEFTQAEYIITSSGRHLNHNPTKN
jgi:hypothetical protein